MAELNDQTRIEAEVARVTAQLSAALGPDLDGTDQNSANARVLMGTLPAYARALAAEQARGTDPVIVVKAAANLYTNMIGGLVMSFSAPEHHDRFVVDLIGKIAEQTIVLIRGGHNGKCVNLDIDGGPNGRH